MFGAVRIFGRAWNLSVWLLIGFFIINLLAMIATVAINSFGTHWFATWLPPAFTLTWYDSAWDQFQLPTVLWVTAEVTSAVMLISVLIGVPAAYVMARQHFPGKQLLLLLFLLPLVVPPMTYGIPMATVLYQAGLGGTIWGVILANLVPIVPFVILIMIPFVEQIDMRIEDAARVFGADIGRLFIFVLVPLLAPGVLAALLLAAVRTIAMFDLTFLTAGQGSETLVVALFYAVFSAGIRPLQLVDAMAIIYMATTLIGLVIALQFVKPTQIVGRVT